MGDLGRFYKNLKFWVFDKRYGIKVSFGEFENYKLKAGDPVPVEVFAELEATTPECQKSKFPGAQALFESIRKSSGRSSTVEHEDNGEDKLEAWITTRTLAMEVGSNCGSHVSAKPSIVHPNEVLPCKCC